MNNKEAGKMGGYLVSIACSLILGFYCYSTDRQGKDLNPLVFIPLIVFLGYGLGVQLDKSELGEGLNKIASLLQNSSNSKD